MTLLRASLLHRLITATGGFAIVLDLALLGTLHLLINGWFLAATDYLPYVFDNNESFSAFVHAENLYRFGLEKTYGLTDEAYGPAAAAHPYVYTHQGNFPRLFAFLLYSVGLRSVEAQIVVSTLTIGLGTIVFCYLAFSQLAGRGYALLVSCLFMTDYVLFAQWQVNTFKVWHGFLLFGMLALIEACRKKRTASWLLLLGIAAMCVGYFDLLMAVFTFMFCAVYATVRLGGVSLRGLVSVLSTIAAGGLASVALLLSQLVAYYGLGGLREDIYLTFAGRNYSSTDPEAIARWQEFFVTHKIVFWEAFVDSRPVAGAAGAVRSAFQYGFTVFTPYLSFLILAVSLGLLVSWFYRPGAPGRARGTLLRLLASPAIMICPAALLGTSGLLLAFPFWSITVASLLAARDQAHAGTSDAMARLELFAALFAANFFLAIVSFTNAVEGQAHVSGLFRLVAGSLLLGAAFSWALWGIAAEQFRRHRWAMLRTGTYLLLLSVLALAQGDLYATSSHPQWIVWDYVLDPWRASGSLKLFVVTTAGLMSWHLAKSAEPGAAQSDRLARVWTFLLAGAAAYLAAFFFSPGYMVKINLMRYTPVLVFVLVPLAALSFFWLFDRFVRQEMISALAHPARKVVPIAATLILTHLLIFWVGVQKSYLDLLPADGAVPFAKMDKPPYAGASFVVSAYGAPVAAKTGSWAYIDQRFLLTGAYRLDEQGYRTDGRDIYKWFADRNDPKYRIPQYALCYGQADFANAVRILELRRFYRGLGLGARDIYHTDHAKLLGENPDAPRKFGCDGTFLLHKAGVGARDGPRIAMIERDPSLLHRWSIAKLEDDFPPYLAQRTSGESASPVELSISRKGSGCSAEISYLYRQQQGKPETGTSMEVSISDPASGRRVVYSGRVKHSLGLPKGVSGTLSVAITPRTATRAGEAFHSAAYALRGC